MTNFRRNLKPTQTKREKVFQTHDELPTRTQTNLKYNVVYRLPSSLTNCLSYLFTLSPTYSYLLPSYFLSGPQNRLNDTLLSLWYTEITFEI